MQQVHDYVPVKGKVKLEIQHPDGSTEVHEHDNLVVQVGLNLIASRLKDATKNAPSQMAIGSSNAIPQANNTALQGTEHDREPGVVTVMANRWQISAVFNAATVLSVSEIGIFNAASGGDMLARFIFPTTNIAAGGILTVTWFIYIGGV